MKAKRNFTGFAKGQIIPADKFSDDKVKLMVKYGFIDLDKKKKYAKKVEASK